MKDKASSVIVELPHTNCTRGDQILYEQKYNTGHGVSIILDEVRRKMASTVPAESIIRAGRTSHLLLESLLGWKRGIPGLPVPTAPQTSQPARRGGAEADPGHAPPQSRPEYGGIVAPAAATRLHPPPEEPVPGDEETGTIPIESEETRLYAKSLSAYDLSRTAYPGRCEGGPRRCIAGHELCLYQYTAIDEFTRLRFWPPTRNSPPISPQIS